MNTKQIPWAAGLWEGEGWVVNQGHNGSLYVGLQMTDEDVVRRFHEVVGVGSVVGPIKKKERWHDQWLWRSASLENSQAVLAAFWSFLGERRKEQATQALATALIEWKGRYVSRIQRGGDKPHGTLSRYTNTKLGGCRCPECLDAYRTWRKAYNARKKAEK